MNESIRSLAAAGYNIEVHSFDLEGELQAWGEANGAGEGAALVKEFLEKERTILRWSPFWYSHLTDLCRYLILWAYGGIYHDLDVILLHENVYPQ